MPAAALPAMVARFNGLSGVWWRVVDRWFPTLCPWFAQCDGYVMGFRCRYRDY